MKKIYAIWTMGLLAFAPAGIQTSTPQNLPVSQNWTNTGLITADDNWSAVPGIVGYRGDDITAVTGADPQALLGEGTIVVDVNANQTNPNTFATGGVAEFEITNPTIAFNGSGTADAPNIVLYLNTTSLHNISVTYNIRDIDGSIDNAVQPVALQYRVGNSGNFTNVPAGFVADATTGPNLATLVTPVSAVLPADCNDQAEIQVRVITANAVGNDECVGIDDIVISGQAMTPTPVSLISFSGYKQGNSCLLSWSTLTEINNNGFEVQRSADGISYSPIGFIYSQAIGGNSTTQLHYAFTDNHVTGSRQFYRLRQVDLDNHSMISNIVLIKADKPVIFMIDGLFPNPANTFVNVLIASPNKDKLILIVTDMTGRTVMQQSIRVETGSNTIPVDISHLANGRYMVKLFCPGCDLDEASVGKFVKQ